MAGFSVNIDGFEVKITKGASIDTLKRMLGDKAEPVFKDFTDEGSAGVLDTDAELNALRGKFKEHKFDVKEEKVEVASDGRTPKTAYAKAIDNMKMRYKDDLADNFDADKKVTMEKGKTLWAIAKQAIKDEGLEPTDTAINNRIAQIAKLNDLSNVNNVPIGTELIVSLKPEAVEKVKQAENQNSAVALGGEKPAKSGNNAGKADDANGANEAKQGEGAENGAEKAVSEFVSELEESKLGAITDNGLNMGKGIPVDKDGNELDRAKAFKKDTEENKTFKADGAIMKYQKGDKVMYQTTYQSENAELPVLNGVKLYAENSIKALNTMKETIKTEFAKIKKVSDGTKDEEKAKIVQDNIAAFRAIIEASGNNRQVIINISQAFLHNPDYSGDFKSEEVQGLTKDLLLTKDAKVVESLLSDSEGNGCNELFENDKTALTTAAQMLKEIRQKELAGEKLTKEECALKNVLKDMLHQVSYDTESSGSLHFNPDGETYYYQDNNGEVISASTEDLFKEFKKKYDAANTDDEKKTLFKEYAETDDKFLARAMLKNNVLLGKADVDDVVKLIKKNGLYVLSEYNYEAADVKIKEAFVNRIKDIYLTSNKGNLDNLRYVTAVFTYLDNTNLSEDDKTALKGQILATFFTETEKTDKEGNKTTKITFNPSRRPTKEEMQALINIGLSDEQVQALKDYVKFEDMGEGQYTEVLEDNYFMNGKYAEFVDNLKTVDDAIDFIKNIYSDDRYSSIPFDELIDKFKIDKNFPKLARVLAKYAPYSNGGDYSVSNENRLKILNVIIPTDEEGKVKFDKSKLPEGTDFEDIVWILPTGCEDGEAKMYFEAVVKQMGPSEILEYATNLKSKGSVDFIKKHVENVCKDQMEKNYKFPYDLLAKGSDNSFKDIIPWYLYADKLGNINKVIEGMKDSSAKRNFAQNLVNGSSDANRLKLVNKNANIYILEALTDYHNNHPSDDMYKKLVAAGFITEVEKNVFVYNKEGCVDGYGTEFYKKTDENKIEVIQSGDFAKNMSENVDSYDDKPRQIAYAKALGNMSPEKVADYYQAYFEEGGEGLLEALDFEANGASMSEFVPIMAKIVQYAKEKGKTDTNEFKNLVNLMNEYKEYFFNGQTEITAENASQITVNQDWADKDFSSAAGTFLQYHPVTTLFTPNPSKKFDEAFKALIKVCKQ